jgi:hypothetical protein
MLNHLNCILNTDLFPLPFATVIPGPIKMLLPVRRALSA